jgi:hypothetical protein
VADSVPYSCPQCLSPDACGFHGILVFEGGKAPTCHHNDYEEGTKACHPEAVRMTVSDRAISHIRATSVFE